MSALRGTPSARNGAWSIGSCPFASALDCFHQGPSELSVFAVVSQPSVHHSHPANMTSHTPFSYAQAAKGMSKPSSAASTAAASKSPSGTMTPAKESSSAPLAPMPTVTGLNWADDVEDTVVSQKAHPTTPLEAHSNGAPSSVKQKAVPNPSSIPPTDTDASSPLTHIKDDDSSSVQNPASDSTWENRSQASLPVEKSVDHGESAAPGPKPKDAEKAPPKTMHEAPPPVVNIWKKRADDAKAAKAAFVAPVAKSSLPASSSVTPNAHSASLDKNQPAQSTTTKPATEVDSRAKKAHSNKSVLSRDEQVGVPRKDKSNFEEAGRPKKPSKNKSLAKDGKLTVAASPLLPDQDQESWPTPEKAVDGGKKKVQDKSDKNEKERNQTASSKPHGKNEWVPVPYTPSVVFHTPIPISTPARRGGKAVARGGPYGSARNGSHAHTAKDASRPASPSNESARRGRYDTPTTRDSSPGKMKRNSAFAPSNEERAWAYGGNKPAKAVTEAGSGQDRFLGGSETASGHPAPGQANDHHPKSAFSRPGKGRRGDAAAQGERRKEGDAISPSTKGFGYERRTLGAQTDGESDMQRVVYACALIPCQRSGDGQMRFDVHGSSAHQVKQNGGDRRQNGAYPGPERLENKGRGGARGGRGGSHGLQTPHQVAESQASSVSPSSTFSLSRSPPSFHPEQNGYLGPAPVHGRGFRPNAPRTQPIITDNVFGRGLSAFSAGPQTLPPLRPVSLYDPSTGQPMSAIAYSSFQPDPLQTLHMVVTQL